MSQENRDTRVGLTGLTPTERRHRLEQLAKELDEKFAVAKARLWAARAARGDVPSEPA